MTDLVLQPETNLADIKNKYENLIQKLLQELEVQKEEGSKLKQQILDIIEESSGVELKTNISRLPEDSDGHREHEQLTSDAISNLKQQVEKLKEERKTINQLWNTSKETIANLETEIESYKNQLFKPNCFTEIKQRYCSAIKSLEHVIENQKNEISNQSRTIRSLIEEKNQSNERLNELQNTFRNQEKLLSETKRLEDSNTNLKEQLQAASRTICELQSSTKILKAMVDERLNREKIAMEKLQEALAIVETALSEREDALKRELIIKEECETLAKTIGQVIEEAVRKVEQDVGALKTQYEKKKNYLLTKLQESLAEVNRQVKATRDAEARCFALEQKLREANSENQKLDQDLQVASQTIIKMELQLNATKKLLDEDKKVNKNKEEHEEKLRHYIDSNHQLKERWKSTIEEMSTKFSSEIQRLQKENANLRAEIEAARQNGFNMIL